MRTRGEKGGFLTSQIDSEALEAAALAWVRDRAATVGLVQEGVRVRPVLSWGGFVNASFHVTDGMSRRHLKLAPAGERAGLETWQRVHENLTTSYRAPRMLAWGPVPGIEGYAVLFEHIDGAPPRALSEQQRDELTVLLRALHADRVLAGALDLGARPGTCAEHYRENHDRRFRADLESVAAAPPPFVTAGDVRWMRDEAERLATAVAASAAFEQPATAPVHGDLWLENLLTTPRGSWHVLDWDDVRLGDPVVDWATVFGPSPGDVRPVEEEELPDAVSLGAAEAERLRLYARATLLDWIVDPLADWIDAAAAGAAEARVRAEKERVHRAAKAFYLDSYGSD